MTMITLPRLTHWCEDCDGPCEHTWCEMELANVCVACHEWLECPCGEETE